MIQTKHPIYLPYTTDLTPAGIACACRAYALSLNKTHKSPQRWMRDKILSTASELAFHRYLTGQNIPFKRSLPSLFDDPTQVQIHLGGRACWLHFLFLPLERKKVQSLSISDHIQKQTFSISIDRFRDEHVRQKDLHLFIMVIFTAHQESPGVSQLQKPSQPHFWWCPLPSRYARPRVWKPLHLQAVCSSGIKSFFMEINGQDRNRNWLSEKTSLSPGNHTHIQTPWHSLSFFHSDHAPDHEITLIFEKRSIYIEPSRWYNIWVEGRLIIMAGYLAQYEINNYLLNHLDHNHRKVDRMLPAKTLNLKVEDLHPLAELLEILSSWENKGS